MFDGEPRVPRSRDEFQKLLQTGKIPLRPSIHSSFVEAHPGLVDSVFAAGSEASGLADTMTNLVRYFFSATGKLTSSCLQGCLLSNINVCLLTSRHEKGLKILMIMAQARVRSVLGRL